MWHDANAKCHEKSPYYDQRMKQGIDITAPLVYVVIPRLTLYPFMACIPTTLP